MLARNVMSPHPFCLTEKDTVRQAAQLMKEKDVGAIPVVKSEKERTVTGIVTDRDLCTKILAEARSPETSVREVMHRDPVSCTANHSVEDCIALMQRHRIRRLPVVDEHANCIGIIALADIALHLSAEAVASTLAEISRPAPGVKKAA